MNEIYQADLDLAVKALEVHQIEWISYEAGYVCGCDDRGLLPPMPFLSDALRHQATEVFAVTGRRPVTDREKNTTERPGP